MPVATRPATLWARLRTGDRQRGHLAGARDWAEIHRVHLAAAAVGDVEHVGGRHRHPGRCLQRDTLGIRQHILLLAVRTKDDDRRGGWGRYARSRPLLIEGEVRLVELLSLPLRNRPLGNRLALGVEDADPRIARVSDEDLSAWADRDADRFEELVRRRASAAPCPVEGAIETEDLDSLVAGVGHVDLVVVHDLPRGP